MGISHDYVGYTKASYVAAAFVSVVLLPLLEVLYKTLNISFGALTDTLVSLPLYAEGLSWLLPTLVVLALVTLVSKVVENSKQNSVARVPNN